MPDLENSLGPLNIAVGFVESIVLGDSALFMSYVNEDSLQAALVEEGIVSNGLHKGKIFFTYYGLHGDVLHGPFSKNAKQHRVANLSAELAESANGMALYKVKWQTHFDGNEFLNDWSHVILRIARNVSSLQWEVVEASTDWNE